MRAHIIEILEKQVRSEYALKSALFWAEAPGLNLDDLDDAVGNEGPGDEEEEGLGPHVPKVPPVLGCLRLGEHRVTIRIRISFLYIRFQFSKLLIVSQ